MKKILSLLTGLLLILTACTSTKELSTVSSSDSIQETQSSISESSVPEQEKIAIDESLPLELNGVVQAINIQGNDVNNPILLWIHGGPGESEMILAYASLEPIEEHFTVVQWDQRNAGQTYFLNNPDEVEKDNNIENILQDTYELTEYLKTRFDRESIIIVGHSWGSLVGLRFAQKYPENVSAYIGLGQFVNAAEGDKIALDALETKIKENPVDSEDVEKVEGIKTGTVGDETANLIALRDLQRKYDMAEDLGNFETTLKKSPFYNDELAELYDTFFSGEYFEKYQLQNMDYLFAFDARELSTQFEVPVFFISGDNDWMVPTPLTAQYETTITAPVKEMIVIPNAGHNPQVDQPEEFLSALIDKILPYISQ